MGERLKMHVLTSLVRLVSDHRNLHISHGRWRETALQDTYCRTEGTPEGALP